MDLLWKLLIVVIGFGSILLYLVQNYKHLGKKHNIKNFEPSWWVICLVAGILLLFFGGVKIGKSDKKLDYVMDKLGPGTYKAHYLAEESNLEKSKFLVFLPDNEEDPESGTDSYKFTWLKNFSKVLDDSTKSNLLKITEKNDANGKKYLEATYYK